MTSVRDDGWRTILLVQCKSGVRNVMATILREHGYTVLEACNTREAAEVCNGHCGPIDLLMTDVEMPDSSGRDLAERLSVQRPAMRVLYVSGYFDPARATVHRACLEAGGAFAPELLTPQSLPRRAREALRPAREESVRVRSAGSRG
jgi:CheY-like chemotaxis protein